VRESVVREAPLFVAANVREVAGRGAGSRTLVSLASAVRREWIEEMFPASLGSAVEHLYDPVHKRVAAVRRVRFVDLILRQDHLKEPDPAAAGRALAEAQRKGLFELPLFNHELRQWVARVNLVAAAMPELEVPPFDEAAIGQCLTRAFRGLTLARDAQEARLREAFLRHLAHEQVSWIDEMAPLSVPWPDSRKLKLTYAEEARDAAGRPNPPELSVKLHECFSLREHPVLCEGRVPVRLWLCAPDGKRLESTVNWPAFRTSTYPKLKSGLQRKHPGFTWL
jgi:ATP-dependent helicase HrpB